MRTLFLAFLVVFGMAIPAQAISQTQDDKAAYQAGTPDKSIEILVAGNSWS